MTIDAAPDVQNAVRDACADVDPATPLGVYIHVPFCATRCGYCDFNTYTAGELGSSSSPESWHDSVARELSAAGALMSPVRPISTIFVGGGTPSLLGGRGLARLLDDVRAHFVLADGAEITTESNPESTSPEFFSQIRDAGFTRVSLGMQSAAPHVLATLDRTHTPGRAVEAAREARNAGLEHVNLDLIYGTPGESDDDLGTSLDAVLDAGVDHVSAYALIVEDGTALARKVRRGDLPAPDDDVLARRYQMIDERMSAAGLDWYEVSNWASGRAAECRHNLGYWYSHDWWGIGPGAHSHINGVRWWNAKHPARYADSLNARRLPVAASEVLDNEDRHVETVMLNARCRTGLSRAVLTADEDRRAQGMRADGLLESRDRSYVLTERGRLLADGVVRGILWG